MRNRYTIIITVMLCLGIFRANAQSTDSSKINFGIWQSNAEKIKTVYYEMNGRLTNFNWKDLEVAPDVWVWTEFDSTFASLAKDKLPFVFMIYTKEDAPDWLYTNGVPKVNEKDNAGNITGYAPYYIDSDYKFFFKRMITTVRQHVERFPDSIRSQIAGVQACFGSTGDYISYKGTVEPQYEINVLQFYNLFTEFTQSYYQEYKNTSPKIYLLSNPSNDGNSEILWLLRRCPGGWIKTGSIGKGFQLNDEKAKSSWLYQTINTPQSGAYVRTRSEITGGATGSDWWLEDPYKNMFALMCYGIYWGLDMSNQGVGELENPLYDSSFNFFNKYAANASQKDPAKSTNAMCALKDVLDAADSTRFPSAIYGAVSRTNTQRFLNIADKFSIFGAKEGDVNTATLGELDNLYATAINDVGWDLLPGNYERFLHQIAANETSIGYWNVQSADTNSMYGRFARGFDIVNGKDGLYFDVDSSFLNNSPLVDNYPVIIDITYLDSGTGSFRLYYDSKAGSDKQSKVFTCTNSGAWKKASVTLPDAYFDNRGLKGADFYIKSINSQNVIFSIIELTRPNWDQSNVGVFCSPVPAFDTVCINGSVKAKSFLVSGSFLNGSALKIGPLNGYRFSLDSEGVYSDTITISNYGTSINKTVYVKLVTSTTGTFSGNLPVRGGIGSTSPVYVSLNGTVINSSPILSANVTSVTCNNYKNGSIDLSPSGGTGTFTYNWTTSGGFYFNSTSEDINQLKPAVYNVTVISQAACQTSASYTITEPEALSVNIIKDSNIICKGGSTTVTVTATGGNTPYNGTGIFSVGSGSRSYPVTDAKGCSLTKGLFVPDGTLIPPSKPSGITGANADAIGVCGNGNFVYTINSVGTATSY
ncbi:MAG TPA: SprB repeat-containing protein, partial [Panacibacter sp.]|nr:SprB repeat-containing protein [Panacibacter sp.]